MTRPLPLTTCTRVLPSCALCGKPAVIVWQIEVDGILDAEARCWDCRGKRRAA